MAKVIQLAKDLLKGGKKEDIYPKTLDNAVFITNSEGSPTNANLKEKLTEVDNLETKSPFYIVLHTSSTVYPNFDELSAAIVAGKIVKAKLAITGRGPYVGEYKELYLTNIDTRLLGNTIVGSYIFVSSDYKITITKETAEQTATVTIDNIGDPRPMYIHVIPMTDVQGYNLDIVEPDPFTFSMLETAISEDRQVMVKNTVGSSINTFYTLVMYNGTEAIFALDKLSSDIAASYIIIDTNGARSTSTLEL